MIPSTESIAQSTAAAAAAHVPPAAQAAASLKLDPRLKSVRAFIEQGDYQRALTGLTNNLADSEAINCRAVCLMRLGKFSQAIGPLRTLALNTSTFHLRSETPLHIRINYALALFFGGEPAGGMEALSDIRREDDPQIKLLRAHAKQWTAAMNVFQRFDWYVNRIAPKHRPTPPTQSVGYCVWEFHDDLAADQPA